MTLDLTVGVVVSGVPVRVGVGLGVRKSYESVPTRCSAGAADVNVACTARDGAGGGVAGNNSAPIMLNTT